MLRQCGFSAKWHQWIFSCVSTARFSILVNGCLSGFFPSIRGLRQGDPLSPLLFLLVMEALSCMMKRVADWGGAADGGFLTSFSVGSQDDTMAVSDLLFADDTLILCGAASDQVWYLRGVFIWF